MAIMKKSLRWYKNLTEKKGRLNAGAFLVEGEKSIRQILDNYPEAIMEIITSHEPPTDFQKYPVRMISESQFRYISNTQTPQGIAAVVKMPPDIYTTRLPPDIGPKILLIEDVQDPGNAGTLIRTAAAFDFSGVILTEKCADPISPKVVQATAGSVMSLWVRVMAPYLEVVQSLHDSGYRVIAAELNGRDRPDVLRQGKFILALGNEAIGLSPALREMADFHVGLAVAPKKAESLNVAVCGGILMYLSQRFKE